MSAGAREPASLQGAWAVEPARPADAPAVTRLASLAFAGTGDAWREDDYLREISPVGQGVGPGAGRERVHVARAGPALVGFVVVRPSDPPEVLQLAVHPDRRREGVGRALLATALADAPGAVWLEVRATNRAARGFYRDLGFEEVGRRAGYYPDDDDAVLLSRAAPRA